MSSPLDFPSPCPSAVCPFEGRWVTVNDRYATFPARAVEAELFGVRLPVAALDDLVRGKLWAAADPARRATKRQKDRLDLTRLAESPPSLLPLIPLGLIPEADHLRTAVT